MCRLGSLVVGDDKGSQLPSGTVTLLFTDIEGSTKLLQELGDAYEGALDDHRQLRGDSFFVTFERAGDAMHEALDEQIALGSRGDVRPDRDLVRSEFKPALCPRALRS